MSTREIVDRFRLKSHALAGVYHKTGNIAYAALAGACHEAAEELDRLTAENQRLLAVKKAAQELIHYEKIGGPDYLHWQERFDALSAALEQSP